MAKRSLFYWTADVTWTSFSTFYLANSCHTRSTWQYGSTGIWLGSCETIRCKSTDTVIGRDGSGCTLESDYDACKALCHNATRICKTKCRQCSGDCLCACQAVTDTCRDMCEIKYAQCIEHRAPVLCNWTHRELTQHTSEASQLLGGQTCCEDERHWCRYSCDYTSQCREGCWRSFTYGWQEPGYDARCARTCGTTEIWPDEVFFKRTLLGTLEVAVSEADETILVRTSRDDILAGTTCGQLYWRSNIFTCCM